MCARACICIYGTSLAHVLMTKIKCENQGEGLSEVIEYMYIWNMDDSLLMRECVCVWRAKKVGQCIAKVAHRHILWIRCCVGLL